MEVRLESQQSETDGSVRVPGIMHGRSAEKAAEVAFLGGILLVLFISISDVDDLESHPCVPKKEWFLFQSDQSFSESMKKMNPSKGTRLAIFFTLIKKTRQSAPQSVPLLPRPNNGET